MVPPKRAAVLAVLLLNANRVVADERIIELVWGRNPPPSARSVLRVHISELRARLAQCMIGRAGSGYLIDVAPTQLDLQVFLDMVAVAQSESRAGHAKQAARRLRSALRLWTGPALDGVTGVLIEHERHSLEEHRLTVVEELFEAELAAGNHTRIVDELAKVTGNHPFRERLAAQLMLTLHRCGRRSEALQVYTDIRRRLVDELGIEPGQPLRDMQVIILNGQDPAEPTAPAIDDRADDAEAEDESKNRLGEQHTNSSASGHDTEMPTVSVSQPDEISSLYDITQHLSRKIDEVDAKLNLILTHLGQPHANAFQTSKDPEN
ncbi:AfsR/SARP family transcriptional regulator [Pseudonocardia acaciae]|uniref:AfsR/SARP family transcriptional regulator n=1 Tax=Pseudonocardia acaciae TaxID=551276 RepID=UPI00147010D6|nr:AfsR/SARP family transcriptional regulator [Pseudonocardia acaciae]